MQSTSPIRLLHTQLNKTKQRSATHTACQCTSPVNACSHAPHLPTCLAKQIAYAYLQLTLQQWLCQDHPCHSLPRCGAYHPSPRSVSSNNMFTFSQTWYVLKRRHASFTSAYPRADSTVGAILKHDALPPKQLLCHNKVLPHAKPLLKSPQPYLPATAKRLIQRQPYAQT
jgi:hypothetical protein